MLGARYRIAMCDTPGFLLAQIFGSLRQIPQKWLKKSSKFQKMHFCAKTPPNAPPTQKKGQDARKGAGYVHSPNARNLTWGVLISPTDTSRCDFVSETALRQHCRRPPETFFVVGDLQAPSSYVTFSSAWPMRSICTTHFPTVPRSC